MGADVHFVRVHNQVRKNIHFAILEVIVFNCHNSPRSPTYCLESLCDSTGEPEMSN